MKFTAYSAANDELFQSLHSKYQVKLEAPTRGSDLIFDSVQLMYYKHHRVIFVRSSSHIDSPNWIKKATTNPKSKGNKCFQ